MGESVQVVAGRGGATRCPACHDDLPAAAPALRCVTCAAACHPDCWSELGRCAACGFASARAPFELGRCAACGFASARAPFEPCRACACAIEGCDRPGVAGRFGPRCGDHATLESGRSLVWAALLLGAFLALLTLLSDHVDPRRPFPPSFGFGVFAFGMTGVVALAGLLLIARGRLGLRAPA